MYQASEEDDDLRFEVCHTQPEPAEGPATARPQAAVDSDNFAALDSRGFGGWKPSGAALSEMSARTPSLRLVDDKLTVYEVAAVKYTCRVRPVEQVFPARGGDPRDEL